MGTRGLLGHIIRGRKKGMYNHFNSFPVGLGVDLARFIKSLTPEQVEKMKEMLESVEWVNERDSAPSEAQVRYVEAGLADFDVDGQQANDGYSILREAHGTVCLHRILDRSVKHVIDSTDFENDTLFCEWTYFVDWEKQEVQIRGNLREFEGVCSFAELSEEWMQELQNRSYEEVNGREG